MFDTGKTQHDSRILDVIKILSTNGANGRLDITAGTTEGMVFFKEGQLVDARVGHLTGFPAVNAIVAIRDARFNFDPSALPPLVSSITPNERVVLKQFFGIESVDPSDAKVVENEEVTLETTGMPVELLPDPVADIPPSRSFYRGGLILAGLFILIVIGAVALRREYRERAVPPTVATTEQPASPAVTEEIKKNDLTGKWNVVNTVQKSSYRSFQDLKIGFDLSINQNGNSFTGKGQKVSENGRSLPANSRTPIEVKGSIEGNIIEATFFEEGALRKTNGRFVWRIDETGSLNGTFVSTAARTSGKSAAKRDL